MNKFRPLIALLLVALLAIFSACSKEKVEKLNGPSGGQFGSADLMIRLAPNYFSLQPGDSARCQVQKYIQGTFDSNLDDGQVAIILDDTSSVKVYYHPDDVWYIVAKKSGDMALTATTKDEHKLMAVGQVVVRDEKPAYPLFMAFDKSVVVKQYKPSWHDFVLRLMMSDGTWRDVTYDNGVVYSSSYASKVEVAPGQISIKDFHDETIFIIADNGQFQAYMSVSSIEPNIDIPVIPVGLSFNLSVVNPDTLPYTQKFSVIATMSDGDQVTVTDQCSFSSTDAGTKATKDGTLEITSRSSKAVYVKALYQSLETPQPLTILGEEQKEVVETGIEINRIFAFTSIIPDTVMYKVRVHRSDGSSEDITGKANYVSENVSLVSVLSPGKLEISGYTESELRVEVTYHGFTGYITVVSVQKYDPGTTGSVVFRGNVDEATMAALKWYNPDAHEYVDVPLSDDWKVNTKIEGLDVGEYCVWLQAPGYKEYAAYFSINPGDHETVQFHMVPEDSPQGDTIVRFISFLHTSGVTLDIIEYTSDGPVVLFRDLSVPGTQVLPGEGDYGLCFKKDGYATAYEARHIKDGEVAFIAGDPVKNTGAILINAREGSQIRFNKLNPASQIIGIEGYILWNDVPEGRYEGAIKYNGKSYPLTALVMPGQAVNMFISFDKLDDVIDDPEVGEDNLLFFGEASVAYKQKFKVDTLGIYDNLHKFKSFKYGVELGPENDSKQMDERYQFGYQEFTDQGTPTGRVLASEVFEDYGSGSRILEIFQVYDNKQGGKLIDVSDAFTEGRRYMITLISKAREGYNSVRIYIYYGIPKE